MEKLKLLLLVFMVIFASFTSSLHPIRLVNEKNTKVAKQIIALKLVFDRFILYNHI